MAKGISITITRMEEVREPRPDDARHHCIWTGTQWTSMATLVWHPSLAEKAGVVPKALSTRLEFPPPGTITLDAEGYKRGSLFKEMVQNGILRPYSS
jgi:hypothetical protein